MKDIYVFGSLVFAVVVTAGSGLLLQGNPLFFLSFFSYIPYAITVIIRVRAWREKE
jgi:hypothetical protein